MRRSTGAAVAIVCVAMAALVGACSSSSEEGARPTSSGPPTTLDRPGLEQPEGWQRLARSPLSARSDSAAAWTGDELVVWGGHGAFSDAGGGDPSRTDGAAYDPGARTWRRLAKAPLPSGQNVVGAADYASAWTGSELLVWGGPGPKAAAYDPKADRWRTFDAGPSAERVAFGSTWTGTELVVVGGVRPLRDQDDPGATSSQAGRSVQAYEPATGVWRMLPDLPFAVTYPAVVWDGERIVVFANKAGGPTLRALVLDPDGGRWAEGPSAPNLGRDPHAAWTGDDAFVVATGASGRPAVAAYDPAARRWRPVRSPAGMAMPLVSPSVVWTGKEVVVLGAPIDMGSGAPSVLEGWAYDPDALAWRALRPPLSARGGATALWADDRLLVWGGELSNGFTSEPRADGAEYRPGPGR